VYIIVVGGGIVGYGLALELQGLPDHEVTIVERSSARARELREQLGEMVAHGDGCEIAFLDSVGAQRCDLLIAVTADDGANLVACQVARHWFNVGRTIARVNDPGNHELFMRLGIDSTVSAASAIMSQIETELPEHTVVPLMNLHGSGMRIVDLHLQEGAPAAGKSLSEIKLPPGSLISLVVSEDGTTRVPDSSTTLEAGDEVIAVLPEGAEELMQELVTGVPTGDPTRPSAGAAAGANDDGHA
jgi:trk system potassium uptake protein TrkA